MIRDGQAERQEVCAAPSLHLLPSSLLCDLLSEPTFLDSEGQGNPVFIPSASVTHQHFRLFARP